MKSEDKIQQECVMWYTNTYCLKHHNPSHVIFHVPNQTKDATERMKKFQIGLLPGVSDLIILQPNRVIFIEMKDDKGTQSKEQKEFQSKVEALGFEYYLCRSLEDFKTFTTQH